MKFKCKNSTEEYELNPETGLNAYVRQRQDILKSRIDVSLYQYAVECPELLLHRQRIRGAINGEHLAKAYATLQDVKKCEEQWNNWKKIKEEK